MTSSAMRMQTLATEVLVGNHPLNSPATKPRVPPEARANVPAPLDANQAIAREKAFMAMRSGQYSVLLQKIKDYQSRSTSAPSDAELEKWRECMEYRIATRKLQSGIVDLQVFPNCSSLPLN